MCIYVLLLGCYWIAIGLLLEPLLGASPSLLQIPPAARQPPAHRPPTASPVPTPRPPVQAI